MIVLQLILFSALFTLMVKIGVGNNALNGLYFYPKPVREKVYELGLTDRETVTKKRKSFMTAFFAVMAVALVLIIRVWNGIQGFWAAYLQAEHKAQIQQEAYRLNMKKLEQGLVSPLEFSTINGSLLKANADLMNSLFKLVIKQSVLRYYRGTDYIDQL